MAKSKTRRSVNNVEENAKLRANPDMYKQKFQVGGVPLATREEFNTAKGQLGFKSGKGGTITPTVEEAVRRNKETETDILARRQMEKDAQTQAVANKVGELTPPNPQLQELQKKQVGELSELDKYKTGGANPTALERNAAAGQATYNAVGSALGMQNVPDPYAAAQDSGYLTQLGLSAVGIVAGTSIMGFSLGNMFSTGGNVDELNSDVGNFVSESRRITSAATTRGANLQDAIKSQILIEEAVRQRYLEAEQSLRNSPKDIKNGVDLIDDMSRNLRMIIENRQALERYQITRDKSELALLSGQMIEEEYPPQNI